MYIFTGCFVYFMLSMRHNIFMFTMAYNHITVLFFLYVLLANTAQYSRFLKNGKCMIHFVIIYMIIQRIKITRKKSYQYDDNNKLIIFFATLTLLLIYFHFILNILLLHSNNFIFFILTIKTLSKKQKLVHCAQYTYFMQE